MTCIIQLYPNRDAAAPNARMNEGDKVKAAVYDCREHDGQRLNSNVLCKKKKNTIKIENLVNTKKAHFCNTSQSNHYVSWWGEKKQSTFICIAHFQSGHLGWFTLFSDKKYNTRYIIECLEYNLRESKTHTIIKQWSTMTWYIWQSLTQRQL